MNYTPRLIPPEQLLDYLTHIGAATTKDIKTHFGVDSSSVRKSIVPLLAADLIWIVARGSAVYYMVNTGKKGTPNPYVERSRAANGEFNRPRNEPYFIPSLQLILAALAAMSKPSYDTGANTKITTVSLPVVRDSDPDLLTDEEAEADDPVDLVWVDDDD